MKSLSVIVECWQKCGMFCKLNRKSKGRVLNIRKKIINTLIMHLHLGVGVNEK